MGGGVKQSDVVSGSACMHMFSSPSQPLSPQLRMMVSGVLVEGQKLRCV